LFFFVKFFIFELVLESFEVLALTDNTNLGDVLQHRAFQAALGRMKSLRELCLARCGLRAFPASVGELESLEVLNLSYNSKLQIDAPLDFLIEGCPRLRWVSCSGGRGRTPEARAHLEAFKAKLLARNPEAKVSF